MKLNPGPRCGCVTAPPSKSHAHRLLIANFLAGDMSVCHATPHDAADILATRRCLSALAQPTAEPILDCGESGSTLRFLAPVAVAMGKRPTFKCAGRLAERPFRPYATLASGLHTLPGDVSSQFVTGLLFALPLIEGASEIRFSSPLESRGYVDMTLSVLCAAGISVREVSEGYRLVGPQVYRPQPLQIEGDWSGAAFWLAMNRLGSTIEVQGLPTSSAQPDRAIAEFMRNFPTEIDVSQFPDIFPVLTIVAAALPQRTRFFGIQRLRLKECDRVAAMDETLTKLGVHVTASEESFVVLGTNDLFHGGSFHTFGDHRIAMSLAVAATHAASPIDLDDAACAAKSYPGFFDLLATFPLLDAKPVTEE